MSAEKLNAMGSASGIELRPASCVLVSARRGAAGAEVAAVHVVEPAEWPGTEVALAAMFRAARRERRLPRRARVVAWQLSAPVSLSDPIARAAVRPLVAAGFRVEAVLTPTQALAAIAASQRRANEGAVAWLSVNRHGAAVAILHGTKILFSRTLQWSLNPSTQTAKEQLLQRYSLVSRIGPELQRGIQQVRSEHRLTVSTVVTCGDLPDLRSLTMPLIEELELEVETLDSSEGLQVEGAAAPHRFAESVPAIRMACAAAITNVKRPLPRVPTAVAAAVLVGVAGLVFHQSSDLTSVIPLNSRLKIEVPPPQPTAVPVVATTAGPVGDDREERPPVLGALPVAETRRGVEPPRVEEPPPVARPSGRASSPEKKGGQQLPPVPPLTSILIDSGRRLAMIGGSIVAVGDRVGPRVIVRIEADSVVLRDPSGDEITVLLRPVGVDAVKSTPSPNQGRP